MFFDLYLFIARAIDEFDNFCTKFHLLLSNINHDFPLCSLVTSQEILMLFDGGRMILLTQQVKKSILSYHQLDINKLLSP